MATERIVNYSLSALRTARTKPNWCSDVRWKIEMRRRASKSRFTALPDVALTPERIYQSPASAMHKLGGV